MATSILAQSVYYASTELKVTYDDLLNLFKKAEGYSGSGTEGREDYSLWLCHQIIRAVKDQEDTPFSQIPLKWSSIMAEISNGVELESQVSEGVMSWLSEFLGDYTMSFGGLDDLQNGVSGENIDWYSAIDDDVFGESIADREFPVELQNAILENQNWSLVGELTEKSDRKTELYRTMPIQGFEYDAKMGVQILARLVNLAERGVLDDCTVILQSSDSFWFSSPEASEEFQRSFVQLDGRVVHPMDLYVHAGVENGQLVTVWKPRESVVDSVSGVEADGKLFSQSDKYEWDRFMSRPVGDKLFEFRGFPVGKDNLKSVIAYIGSQEASSSVIDCPIKAIPDGVPLYQDLVRDSITLADYVLDGKLTVLGIVEGYLKYTQLECKNFYDDPSDLNLARVKRFLLREYESLIKC